MLTPVHAILSPLIVALMFVQAPTGFPNDPFFADQVSFRSGGSASIRRSSTSLESRRVDVPAGVALDLPRAWTVTTGSRSVVVAVIDDGFAYMHEDIADNVWRNPGETGIDATGIPRAANRRDDDNNGYVDDVVGYDFVFDDPDPDAYSFDGMDRTRVQPYWHSIGALGIIGARGNNGLGIAGINWDVSMMLLRIGAQGESRIRGDSMRPLRAARAIRYAADNGARVINWSGFVRDTSAGRLRILRDALRYAMEHDVLLVTAAGNDGVDIDDDTNCLYPQCNDGPNTLRVAELDFDGSLVRYQAGDRVRGSNFGKRRVEIAAIGQNFSTMIYHAQDTYSLTAGTSNASPVVAGVAALMLAANPRLHASELRGLLMATATRLPGLTGKVASGGAVNARRAVTAARAGVAPLPSPPQYPDWVGQLGYRPEDVVTIRRGHLDMPFVTVTIGDSTYSLLFDTGNMVGLTLTSSLLDHLHLPELGRWNSLDSDGRVIGSYRRVRAPTIHFLGRTLVDQTIFEFADSNLTGLVGPDALPGTRFTLDHRSGLLAVSNANLGTAPLAATILPLTRSSRHARLILVSARVNGHSVLVELDTGASRTNIDPVLANLLGLARAPGGVRIDSLSLGPLVFSVPSARINPKSGIDPTMNPPIQLAIGSDILSKLVLTVDYTRGQVIIFEAPAR